MKKSLFFCIMFVLTATGAITTEASNSNSAINAVENYASGTQYFVVIGSFQELSKAIEYVEDSDITSVSWVYEVVEKGRRLYRVVYARCRTRAEALREKRCADENDYGRFPYGGWIWTYKGGARVVYKGSCE